MNEPCEDRPPLNAEAGEYQPAELDDECFEPVLPRVIEPPRPAPKPKRTLGDLMDETYLKLGILTKAEIAARRQPPDPEPTAATDEDETAQVDAELPPPRVATAPQLFTWIRRVLLAKTPLSGDAAELVAIWVISTWLQDALTIRPCLIITGPAHDASRVLRVLNRLCARPALLAGFARSHLAVVGYCRTLVISEPNFDKRTASLLSSLTDRECLVVAGSRMAQYSTSTAIYAGESPDTHKIQNSIHIHLTTTGPHSADSAHSVETIMKRLPVHQDQYRDKNLNRVKRWPWIPVGVSSEMAAAASSLGRCIVDAPKLQLKLLELLKAQDKERLSDRSNTAEAVAVEATLNLCHRGKDKMFAGEIAAEVNAITKQRGERLNFSAENVGHTLKKIGLSTRRLGKAGKGLVMDQATIRRLHVLAVTHGGVGLDLSEENLHCQLCTENK